MLGNIFGGEGKKRSNKWDNSEEGFFAERDQRIQNKIIATFTRNDWGLLALSSVFVGGKEKEKFYQHVRDGSIGSYQAERLLEYITDNGINGEDSSHRIFQKIEKDKHMMGIVARIVRERIHDRDSLTDSDFQSFLDLCPQPKKYSDKVIAFLKDMGSSDNHPDKLREYEHAAQRIGKLLYGKKWDYFEQIRILFSEAKRGSERIEKSIEKDKIAEELRAFIDSGIDLIRRGKYSDAISFFFNQKKAKEFGIILDWGRHVTFTKSHLHDPDKWRELVDQVAMWSRHEDGKITLASVLLSYKDEQEGKIQIPDEILKGVAVIHAEEWLHALEYVSKKPLFYQYQTEARIAAFIGKKGVELSSTFLRRYDGRKAAYENEAQ